MQRHETLRAEFPLLCRAARRDRRHREAEPRHDRRQHRERVAGGGHAARAARLRRRARARLGPRAPRACPTAVSHRLQADGPGAGRADLGVRLPRRRGLDAALPQSRRAARAGDLEGVFRRRGTAWTQGASPTSGSRSAAWRRRSCVRRRRSAPLQGVDLDARPHRRGRRGARLPSSRRSTTCDRRPRTARAWRSNLLREFLTACAQR